MSTPGPFGGGPFEGLPMFADLARLFANQGSINWEVARQIAVWLATEGASEPNVEPLERIRLEELARVADLHVADATGLSTAITGGIVSVRPVGRGEWASATLDAWKPLLERLATALTPAGEEPNPETQLLGNLAQVMSPVMLGLQAGSMVGHLAQVAFGPHHLPIPRHPNDELLVVGRNIDSFAADWSLPLDDVRLWICLSEIAHHAVLGRPHVRARLEALLGTFMGGFRIDPDSLQAQLGSIDPSDMGSLEHALGDPEALLGAMSSPEQDHARAQIDALVVAIEGYIDYVMDTVGTTLIGSFGALTEALRRRRVQRGEGDRFVERLFGLSLDQDQYDRGNRFVNGVLERAGDEGLARLWRSTRELPTPAEIEAPGLWLERISYD
ncbi:MAG TPA: zinc-dependent metalloprotease [Acidimicrobiales bacterium]|nr:zinc-dependent metalloprotease [Acidimicrobiales bacterium]